MKNLFLLFLCLVITTELSTLVYAQRGAAWTLYGFNPVFASGTNTWDKGTVSAPCVIIYKDTLRMWYEGNSEYGFSGYMHIGYAWSLDGINWHRKDSPVLSPRAGQWDWPHVGNPHVIIDGDTLRMWYGGGKYTRIGMGIGYAVSVDGINWNRYPDPVIKQPQLQWCKDGVLPGGVMKENGVFKMWFSGGISHYGYPSADAKWGTGFATSSDGIHWTLSDEPVLQPGSGRAFDLNFVPCSAIIKTVSGYEMWYGGFRSATSNKPAMGSIGYATSPDGITWEKYEINPVLTRAFAATGTFGDAFIEPTVLFDGKQYRMWFAAWHGASPTIGYATSVVTGIEDGLTQLPKEYKLFQNYPNPFNPSTTIKYSIPERSFVSLKVYDVLGRENADLIGKIIDSGNHKVTFAGNSANGTGLTSGVYFYTLYSKSLETNKENRITRKMIILK